jgi:DNA-binding beta-propeller fold protein YncE
MERWAVLLLAGCATVAAQQAPIPSADGLPGRPFAIKHTWIIGGNGNWDYLTMDPSAGQLFIAHGRQVQIVDVSTGAVTATVSGFQEAHQIALDDTGEFAYVSDGLADLVRVVDRRTFEVVANIPTGPSPRALALDPATGLLFVVCSGQRGENVTAREGSSHRGASEHQPHAPPPSSQTPAVAPSISTITVIDAQQRKPLADIWIAGRLGFAQSDGSGEVYIAVQDRNQIARLSAQTVAAAVQNLPQTARSGEAAAIAPTFAKTPLLDWTGIHQPAPAGSRPHLIRIGQECQKPQSLAVDASAARLFVACNNQKMAVVNANNGDLVSAFTIGPGAESIAYDSGRGLIFTANGGGYGSVTIIRRDVTDAYAVVQNLPTLQQARTLAVNPANGDVYVVTTLFGANLANPPVSGLGTLKVNPVAGSFQVLVIGN